MCSLFVLWKNAINNPVLVSAEWPAAGLCLGFDEASASTADREESQWPHWLGEYCMLWSECWCDGDLVCKNILWSISEVWWFVSPLVQWQGWRIQQLPKRCQETTCLLWASQQLLLCLHGHALGWRGIKSFLDEVITVFGGCCLVGVIWRSLYKVDGCPCTCVMSPDELNTGLL